MKNALENFRCRVCYCGPIFGWCVYRGKAQMSFGDVRQGPMTREEAEKICRRLNGEEVAKS